jgi:hypothetical protein
MSQGINAIGLKLGSSDFVVVANLQQAWYFLMKLILTPLSSSNYLFVFDGKLIPIELKSGCTL